MEVGPGRPDALIDTEDGVVVEGARPGARVRLEARLELGGQTWSCAGEYAADAHGRVDTLRDPSLDGSYRGVDPFGLFWSAAAEGFHAEEPVPSLQVTVLATTEHGDVAETGYTRAAVASGVDVRAVREDGVVGRVHLPPGPDAPGLVILAGSGGGLGGGLRGALLASHGVAALSLAHWNYPGTPPAMRDIDVEVVGTACDWLRRQPGVANRSPAVLGISRGGELALLAGSLMPDRVGDVICEVGSGVAWGAYGPDTHVTDQAWRFGGRPVPQMREDEDDPDACLADPDQVAAAEIAVERCSGRVLLVSGEDDQTWPSARLSELAVRRAERYGVTDRVEHVCHRGAGHGCGAPPGFAVPETLRHPVDGEEFSFGGTRSANQVARRDSWRRLLDLLGV